jgi:rare lipoprotein A
MISLFVVASCCSSAICAQSPDAGGLDRSGEPRRGEASYYASKFAGKKMADGTPMDPESNAAASKTLPLGTKAEVINLHNGKSAIVEIRDRGPHVSGRIVDLTPQTAKKLDIHEKGVAPVIVAPLEVPQADGSIKREPRQRLAAQ